MPIHPKDRVRTMAEHVRKTWEMRLRRIIDGGQVNRTGIYDRRFTEDVPVVLRPGYISLGDAERGSG